MSAQAYDKVWVYDNLGTATVENKDYSISVSEKQNVILIPQLEYNLLLEWVQECVDNNSKLMDKENIKYEPDQSYYGAWQAFEAVKEKLTSLNNK